MNYRRMIKALRKNRDGWLEILNKNPDSLNAAQYIVTINAQIQLLETSRHLDGDYEPID